MATDARDVEVGRRNQGWHLRIQFVRLVRRRALVVRIPD